MLKKNVQSCIALTLMGFLPCLAQASWMPSFGWHQPSGWHQPGPGRENHNPDKETAKRGLHAKVDDITPDQENRPVRLTPQDLHQAQVWGLSKEEEQRYLQLMQNRSANYWPHDNPLEILGLNARTPEERADFAKRYAKTLEIRIARELAWNAVVQRAKQELNQGIPAIRPFNTAPFSPYRHTTLHVLPGDHYMFFTRSSLPVRREMNLFYEALKEHGGFDVNIFFMDKPNAKAVQAWAKRYNIPHEWTDVKRLTLNTDVGTFEEVLKGKKLPFIARVRDGRTQRLSLGG